MPRWQRQVSPQLQGALPMGEEGLLGELWVLLHPPSLDWWLLASASWREMQPLGSCRLLGSRGEMVSSR